MRAGPEGGGCFPTGRHYPGIAHLLRVVARGLADEFAADLAMSEIPLVSIDTETTGRDPAVDRIVEIACVVYERGQIVERSGWLVNPERPIPEDASAVHGIKDADVADKPTFAQIHGDVLAVLKGRLPVAYNAEFDRAFLVDELSRLDVRGKALPAAARPGIEWVDPLTWARELQKEEKSKALGEVAARLGIEINQAHRATDDAEAAIRVLAAFMKDSRMPQTYGAFIQEQRRLERLHAEDRAVWRNRTITSAAPRS